MPATGGVSQSHGSIVITPCQSRGNLQKGLGALSRIETDTGGLYGDLLGCGDENKDPATAHMVFDAMLDRNLSGYSTGAVDSKTTPNWQEYDNNKATELTCRWHGGRSSGLRQASASRNRDVSLSVKFQMSPLLLDGFLCRTMQITAAIFSQS